MVQTLLSLILNFLFWFALFVVTTGGFDYQGSVAGQPVRVDATSPDLLVLALLLLMAIWSRLGWPLRELHFVRVWESIYERLSVARKSTLFVIVGPIAAVAVVVPLVQHFSFLTSKDLALFGQAYWNTLQGDFLFSTIQGGIVLWGEHFNPIVLGILPFYWLWPSPETLLVLQSLALVSGVIPLYLLALRELSGKGVAIFIAIAYLAYLPVRQTNLFEFHPIAFATPLILAAFYFLRRETLGGFLLCCLLVGATKETGPIAVGLLGAAWFFLNSRRWVGAGVAVTAGIWFVVNLTVVMPAFHPAGVGHQLARYSYLGESPIEMLQTLVTRPIYAISENFSTRELFYPIRILAPVAFLPLLTPLGLLMVPYLMLNILEGSGVQVWLVHYQAELTAFVFIATVFGAKRMLQQRSALRVAAFLTAGSFLFFGTSDIYHLRKALPSAETRQIHQTLSELPAAGRVSAQAAIAPHLTQRKWLQIFPEVADSEWVIVDLRLDPWPVRADRLKRTVKRLKWAGFLIELEEGQTRILKQSGMTPPKRRKGKKRAGLPR